MMMKMLWFLLVPVRLVLEQVFLHRVPLQSSAIALVVVTQMILFSTNVSSFTLVSSRTRKTKLQYLCRRPLSWVKRNKILSYNSYSYHQNTDTASVAGASAERTSLKVLPHTKLSSTSKDLSFSFDEMSKLDQRIEVLEEQAPSFLFDYYEPRYFSFSIAPGKAEKLSITSTAYCLRALLEYYPQEENLAVHSLPPTKDVIKALIQSDWRSNDLYVVSLVVLVILRLDPTLEIVVNSFKGEGEEEQEVAQIFMKLVMLVLSGRPQRRRGEQQLFSAYISYLCCSVYVDLKAATRRNLETGQLQLGMLVPQDYHSILDFQNGDNDAAQSQKEDAAAESIVENGENTSDVGKIGGTTNTSSSRFWKELTIAISRTAEISFNELCRQLAYHTAGSSSFDIIKLVYSLLSYIKSCNSLRGTAGWELIAGTQNRNITQSSSSSNSEKEEIIKLNPQLVSAALNVFFQEQDATTGLWDRGQPIYKSFKRKGRNVGNAYVFGLDALGSLLEALPPEDFRPYLLNLQRTLNWIELIQDVEVIADYCDPDTGECYGKTLRGWTSPNLRYVCICTFMASLTLYILFIASYTSCLDYISHMFYNHHSPTTHSPSVHLEAPRHGPLLRL